MNFVVFGCCFPPMADPESYCTARFVSALAAAGHNVWMIAPDHPTGMLESTYRKLVDERVKVVKVPQTKVSKRPFWARLRYFSPSWHSVDFPAYIRAVRKVLKDVPNAVLVSRTLPMDSVVVADHCRKVASKWVFHVSDPIPCRAGKGSTWRGWLMAMMNRYWLKRALRHADAFSVTCDNALKFYRENLGSIVDERPNFVTTHIGDFSFRSNGQVSAHDKKRYVGKLIVHPGELHKQRGGLAMIDTVARLNAKGCLCTFLQAGNVNRGMLTAINSAKHVEIFNKESIQNSVSATQLADVVFVPDYSIGNHYSGTLMSKFVYQVYEDKPIVVYSLYDSAKRRYAEKYPEAGIFWADSAQPETLDRAIEQAFSFDAAKIDRTAIRAEFSAQNVVTKFMSDINRLI